MFDVYGLVSEYAQDHLRDVESTLFPLPPGATLDSAADFKGRRDDHIRVAGATVELKRHVYHFTFLGDADAALRPIVFAKHILTPAVRAVSKGFADQVEGAAVVAVRAAGTPSHTGDYGGSALRLNGVDMRWFVDFDHQHCSDRLVVDFYLGTR